MGIGTFFFQSDKSQHNLSSVPMVSVAPTLHPSSIVEVTLDVLQALSSYYAVPQTKYEISSYYDENSDWPLLYDENSDYFHLMGELSITVTDLLKANESLEAGNLY